MAAATNYFRVGRALIPFDGRSPDAVDMAFREATREKASTLGAKKPAIVLYKPVPGIAVDAYVGVASRDMDSVSAD